MDKEEKKRFYENLKKNPSFEPIADLLLLVERAQKMAREAERIGDSLSVFAAKAEAGQKVVPAMEPWMELCDFYKDGARDFALGIRTAVRDSGIQSLPDMMRRYNNDTGEKFLFMLENDPDFRSLWEEMTGEEGDD